MTISSYCSTSSCSQRHSDTFILMNSRAQNSFTCSKRCVNVAECSFYRVSSLKILLYFWIIMSSWNVSLFHGISRVRQHMKLSFIHKRFIKVIFYGSLNDILHEVLRGGCIKNALIQISCVMCLHFQIINILVRTCLSLVITVDVISFLQPRFRRAVQLPNCRFFIRKK